MKWPSSTLERIIYCITNPHSQFNITVNWMKLSPTFPKLCTQLHGACNELAHFFFLKFYLKKNKRKRRQHVLQTMRVESWAHEFLLNSSNKESLLKFGGILGKEEFTLTWTQRLWSHEETVQIPFLAFLPTLLFTSSLSFYLSSTPFHSSLPTDIKQYG